MHFNPNHDPKTGQFSSSKGMSAKKQKKIAKFRSKVDSDLKYAKDNGHLRMVRRKKLKYIIPTPYFVMWKTKSWYEPALKRPLVQARRLGDIEYEEKIKKALGYD